MGSLDTVLGMSMSMVGLAHGVGYNSLEMLVEFRMIVFRPFKGDIIAAVVKRSVPSGIQGQCEAGFTPALY